MARPSPPVVWTMNASTREGTVDAWQLILLAFFFLLPMVLMVDFWGDERLTFRGRPVVRGWKRQVEHPDPDAEHH